MSTSEHPSTYFVQDRSNLDEMTRLRLQDQLLTASMGGVLSEQADPSSFGRVLDVGCGTGGWLIETAKNYPMIKLLVGVDVSEKMLDYAQDQAEAQGVSDQVSFHVMDALRMLEFPDDFFNLINQRLGMSYLRTWDWPKLLQEYQRVCRSEGIVRITESNMCTESNSAAVLRLNELLHQALTQAGHFFKPVPDGITSELAGLLSQHGFQNVQTRPQVIEYQSGTEAGMLFFEDGKRVFRNIVPFLRKWTRVPDDYEEIYQQALTDMQQPDFQATWRLLTVWGTVPPKTQEAEPPRSE